MKWANKVHKGQSRRWKSKMRVSLPIRHEAATFTFGNVIASNYIFRVHQMDKATVQIDLNQLVPMHKGCMERRCGVTRLRNDVLNNTIHRALCAVRSCDRGDLRRVLPRNIVFSVQITLITMIDIVRRGRVMGTISTRRTRILVPHYK